MKPKLEALMHATMADPRYEERHFRMDFTREEKSKYIEWFCGECDETFKPRPQIGIGGSGMDLTCILRISNYKLRNARSQQSEAYEFYGMHDSSTNKKLNYVVDALDPTKIKERTFHELMVNANLTIDEINRGGFDSAVQSPVDVLPITLKSVELDKAVQELIAVIDSSLKKSMKPLVVTVFNLDPKAKFLANQLLSGWTQIFSKSSRYCAVSRATIYEDDERRLYLALNNDLRGVLDIHHLTQAEAEKKVQEFIFEKYNNFQTELQIMPGVGKNSPNGFSILMAKLPEWLEDDAVSDLIVSHGPNAKNPGVYDITLVEPISLLSPELNLAPFHIQHMIRCGAITTVRPSLDGESWIFQYGKEPEIKTADKIDVRLADEEVYLKAKRKAKQANKGPKAAKQPAVVKAAPKAPKQQDARKAAPKAPKQQAAPKAAPKAAKKGPAPKAGPKAAPKKKGGKK